MTFLETKIPPPLLAIGFGILMWGIALVVPPFDLPDFLRIGLGTVLIVTGHIIASAR